MNVKGKVVIVTASTRGIGWACVQAFVREGAIVYLAARNEEAAKKRIEELSGEPGQAKWVYCDASVKESYASMAETVEQAEGRIDVLVNNFGTSDPRTDLDIARTRYEDFLDTLDKNLSSVFLSTQPCFLP